MEYPLIFALKLEIHVTVFGIPPVILLIIPHLSIGSLLLRNGLEHPIKYPIAKVIIGKTINAILIIDSSFKCFHSVSYFVQNNLSPNEFQVTSLHQLT